MSDKERDGGNATEVTRPIGRRQPFGMNTVGMNTEAQSNSTNAHLAAARFDTVSRMETAKPPAASALSASQPYSERSLIGEPMMLAITSSPQRAMQVAASVIEGEHEAPEMRLPAAWYAKPKDVVEIRPGLSPERHGLLIRATAAACLTTAAGLLVWLGTMGNPPTLTPSPANRAELQIPALASGFAPARTDVPTPTLAARPAPSVPALQDQITTAQILAVAERFVATGDVLAARAMLQDRAGSGEPRALFALAETYDPHMLASWSAGDAEPSVTYARFLYEAARRGGITEAQPRIEALR